MNKQPPTKRTPIRKRRHRRDEEHRGTVSVNQPLGHSDLGALQNQIGNAAVQRLLAERNGQQQLDPNSAQAIVQNALQRQEEEVAEQAPANGEVTIEEPTVETYDVTGATLAEVAQQLDPNEWGRCTYQFAYSYEITNGRATKVDITLTLTIRLPRWQGEGWNQASDGAKAEWNRMLEALRSHEDAHAEIARRGAPLIQAGLMNQRSGRINARFNRLKRQVDQETEQFDQQTNHGRNDGVTLDLSIQ